MEGKIQNSGQYPLEGVSKEKLFSTSQIEVRLVKDEKELDDMFYQRWLVLRSPLGMERGSEKDKYDDSALHLVAVCNNRVIGSARRVDKYR